MKGIVVLLLFIASLGEIKSYYFNVLENQAMIINFHWPADAASVGTLSYVETLYFRNFEGDILPQNFTDLFQKCIKIYFNYGKVKIIHISPKLTHIELESTATENVFIESRKYYQLEKFLCRESSLTRIPENISQLKKLKYLDLSYNSIQTVQLDQFNGLDNLETLYLFRSKINHIYNYGSVSLPSLTKLHLGYNQLKHIDVCSWNMPKLSYLNLVNNELTHFAINHFRELKEVNLAKNPLNCVWKNSFLRDRTDIEIPEKLTCDTNSTDVFEIDCPLTIDQLQQQISNFDSRLSRIEETALNNFEQFSELSNRVQKLEADINRRFEKIEELLEKHNSTIVEQHNVSNNIIEAFYRAEIERTDNTNRRFEKIEELQEKEKLSSKIVEQQNISKDIIETIYRAEIEKTYSTEKTP